MIAIAIAVATLLPASTSQIGGPAGAAEQRPQSLAPIGIDLAIAGGEPQPLELVPRVSYRIDQIDISAADERPDDDGLAGLRSAPVFAALDWTDLELVFDEAAQGIDGTPFQREIYRHATWMTEEHAFTIVSRDVNGQPLSAPIELVSAADRRRIQDDDFPIRRPAVFRDIHTDFYRAEAWLQLRNADATPATGKVFEANADLAELELRFDTTGDVFRFPVTLVSNPAFAYGFAIDVTIEGASGRSQADGEELVLEPGETLHAQVTFRDGDGARLHPVGDLPTYNEFLAGLESGLRYFDFYPSVLYFKDKNKEGVLLASMAGPTNRIRQTYTEVAFEEFANVQQIVATRERDGYTNTWQLIPSADILFGGLQDPALWDLPVSDELDFAIPENAQPGEYLLVIKARRVYLSQSSLVTTTVRFQVAPLGGAGAGRVAGGTPFQIGREGDPISRAMRAHHSIVPKRDRRQWVGQCDKCHEDNFELGNMLHGNDDTGTCAACHAPLAFEPDNMLAYRVHFLHFFSDRNPLDQIDCQACHIAPQSVQRTSRLVCLSCHREYHGGADEFGLYMRCDFPICHDDAHDF